MTPASCCGRFLDIISLGNVLLDIFDLFQIRGASLELCLTGANYILYDLLLTQSIKTNHFTLSCQTGDFTFCHKFMELFERNKNNILRYTSWMDSHISVTPLMVIKDNNMVISFIYLLLDSQLRIYVIMQRILVLLFRTWICSYILLITSHSTIENDEKLCNCQRILSKVWQLVSIFLTPLLLFRSIVFVIIKQFERLIE